MATAASLAGLSIQPTFAGPPSLKAKLDARDSSLLTKPSGGAPPGETVFPAWMAGEWKVKQSFAGYELPAKDKIDRTELFAEADVPGFKKCSIALLPDVGKEGVSFPMRWAADSSGLVREDRVFNYRAATRGGLGYDAHQRLARAAQGRAEGERADKDECDICFLEGGEHEDWCERHNK